MCSLRLVLPPCALQTGSKDQTPSRPYAVLGLFPARARQHTVNRGYRTNPVDEMSRRLASQPLAKKNPSHPLPLGSNRCRPESPAVVQHDQAEPAGERHRRHWGVLRVRWLPLQCAVLGSPVRSARLPVVPKRPGHVARTVPHERPGSPSLELAPDHQSARPTLSPAQTCADSPLPERLRAP